jgi:protein-S-isoprenylcysteine O-methyltransferase Ste14
MMRSVLPLALTWPYALAFWGVVWWAFAPEGRIVRRPSASGASRQDAGSKLLILVSQVVATGAAFAIASRATSGALPDRVWLFWAGLALVIAGSLLRRHCWRMLGTSFTGAVVVSPDQAVVERGAYRYVRHPSYTGGALLYLGIGVALANWISIVVLMLCVTVGYGYRVFVEERALAMTIGDPYRRYMRRTKRFVPFVF